MFRFSKRFYYYYDGYLHYIRTPFDDSHDFVNMFQCPRMGANRNFNFHSMALIDHSTPAERVVIASAESQSFKDCGDDVGPMWANGAFIGANHGNPNFLDVYTEEHLLKEKDIGTVWTDGNFEYTVAAVPDKCRLLLLSLDGNGFSTAHEVGEKLTPKDAASGSGQIRVVSSGIHMNLRPCGNRFSTEIIGDGEPVKSDRFYENIIAADSYTMLDAADVAVWLQDHVGDCTNRSYYENDVKEFALRTDRYEFDDRGRVSCTHHIEFKKEAYLKHFMGAQVLNFTNDGSSFVLVPGTDNASCWIRSEVGTEFRAAEDRVPSDYFLKDPEGRKGFYVSLDREFGNGRDEVRKAFPKLAYNSVWRTKLYIYGDYADRIVPAGYTIDFSYSRGPFDPGNIGDDDVFHRNGKICRLRDLMGL